LAITSTPLRALGGGLRYHVLTRAAVNLARAVDRPACVAIRLTRVVVRLTRAGKKFGARHNIINLSLRN
jgi:hypothetical protein